MQKSKSTSFFTKQTDIDSLKDKVILITGANSGLGKQTAMELVVAKPREIWIAARNASKAKSAVEEVQAAMDSTHSTTVKSLHLDLASFASIKQAALTFLAASDRLDVLFLNAGILGGPAGITEEGYEIQMGTNHIGHALLLKLLAPTLTKTATIHTSKHEVRAVILTSIGALRTPSPGIAFEKLKPPVFEERAIVRYTQSKLANLLYAREAAKHYTGFTTISVHPGEADTDLFRKEPGDEEVRNLLTHVAPKHVTPVEDCVASQLWAAFSKDVVNGKYYEPIGIVDKEVNFARDQGLAIKLWDWTHQELEGHSI